MRKTALSFVASLILVSYVGSSYAQTWQQGAVCLAQPPLTAALIAGPEVIATKHADGVFPNFASSAILLSKFPVNPQAVKLYCNVNRKPCVGGKCFGVHISSASITAQPNGTARVVVAGWNDNRNNGKDYYLQMFADLPEGGVIGPTP
jgi:hypothetical protein